MSDLDQFSIEQDAAIRGPRTSVETEVAKEIRSEFAEMSRRVGSFDQPDVNRERSSPHRCWSSKLLDAPACSDDVVGGEAHRASQAHIVVGSPHPPRVLTAAEASRADIATNGRVDTPRRLALQTVPSVTPLLRVGGGTLGNGNALVSEVKPGPPHPETGNVR